MTNVPYTTGIPNPPNDPSVDVGTMQTNANSINSIIQQDHIGFNQNNGGWHTLIHTQDVSGNSNVNKTPYPPGPPLPAASYIDQTPLTGIQAPFYRIEACYYKPNTTNASQAPDVQLFGVSSLGGLSQLTGNNAQANGWCWCGGVLLQWGFVAANADPLMPFPQNTTTVNSVTFQSGTGIPYPRNLFIVNATPYYTDVSMGPGVPNSYAALFIDQNPAKFLKTGFTWSIRPNTSNCTGFYWFAIGN